ncbi:Hypothetical predicted protein [Xyrichtys novacula]|uniref:Uncharacterized protein n=1 Tax=Xyrichtys novacula TaxID=13765 RepID=A0AAV1EVL1_XYRNO|nr:Hypothetical predicted protein [Xyrichtys novacula]
MGVSGCLCCSNNIPVSLRAMTETHRPKKRGGKLQSQLRTRRDPKLPGGAGKGCLSSACFQLHPASNWCSIATIRKPQTFPETTTAINVTSTGASSPPFLFLTFFLGDSLDFSECLSLKKSKLLILKCVVNNRKVAKLVQF